MKTRSIVASIIGCALALFITSREGHAATVYTYTGLPFSVITDGSPPDGTYTDSMMVSGSFTVAAPLLNLDLPTNVLAISQSFSFSDGRANITNLNAAFAQLDVVTDGAGQIVSWSGLLTLGHFSAPFNVGDQVEQIELNTDAGIPQIITQHDFADIIYCNAGNSAPFCLDIREDIAQNRGLGTWSMTTDSTDTTTPLPSALPLFATGLGVIGLVTRRRKRQPAVTA